MYAILEFILSKYNMERHFWCNFYFYLCVIYLLFRLSDQTILSTRTDTMEESQDKHVEFNHIDLFRVCVEK